MRRSLAPGLLVTLAGLGWACGGPSPAVDDEPADAPASTRTEVAAAPPAAATPEPEPEPVTGYAILPGGTELRLLPDPAAPTVALPGPEALPSAGPLPEPVRGAVVMVSGRDGDFLEVETLPPPAGERHCESASPGLEDFRLRFFVPRDAPASVTTRPATIDGADGTRASLPPGMPLRRRASGRWLIDGGGVRFEGSLPDEVVGHFYEPDPLREEIYAIERLPEGAELRFDGAPLQGAEHLPGAPWFRIHGTRRDDDGHLVGVTAGCSMLELRSSTEPVVLVGDPELAATTGLLGPGPAPAVTEHEVRPGTTVYWADHRVAGQVLSEHRFATPPQEQGPHRCFPLPLATGELTLCFDPTDVHELAPPLPTFGLGLSGTGAGGSGVGLGSIGSSGAGAGTSKPAPPGTLDKEEIRRVIRSHISEVKSCYETSLATKPSLEGRVVLSITIASSGKVASATISDDTLSEPAVGACLTKLAEGWVFPRPRGGGTVVVRYPFVFKPS
ncbi:MAG: AgmX/PglI C-terminal domain-containing protein [Myxococcales bacterium]|nr:AgmX/PglI C-terminal domain-containing protein [Myxococcales bacterium]